MSNYVNAGIKVNVTEVGGAWAQGDGYIEQSGVNKFLYAGESISAGDFTIKAKLSLAELNATAASFDFAGNRFGFDGNSNRFFTEGVDWGGPQFHGNAGDHITPGQIFDLDVVRNGADISFSINGTTIVTRTLNSGSLANVGFRPWRNTIRLYDFYRTIGTVSNPFFSETVVFESGTNGYAIFRIPAIIRVGNGDLLAFAEGRVTGSADFGNVDIVMRRSTDNGSTWGPLAVIVDNGGLQAGNPGVVVDTQDNNKIVLVYNMGNASEQDVVNGKILANGDKAIREVWVRMSTDNGNTWSSPINITTSVHRLNAPQNNPAYNFPEDWRWHAVLPGHAIQLTNGRLIFAANYKLADDDSRAFVFYSDDHGVTWQMSNISGQPGIASESQLVQLNNGDVMMNARPNAGDSKFRRISISTDNGNNWSPFQVDTELPDPTVEGSIIRFTTSPSRILFSNPADQTSRVNLTVRVSYDEGDSWTYSLTVDPGSSAYSDLVIESDNKTIGLLYESDFSGFIRYARFNIEWLTNGQDSLT